MKEPENPVDSSLQQKVTILQIPKIWGVKYENTSKRQKEDEECSFESPVKRSKHSCMLSMKRPGKQSSHRSLGAKGKKNGKHKSSITLRATTTFPEQLFFMSPTSNLANH